MTGIITFVNTSPYVKAFTYNPHHKTPYIQPPTYCYEVVDDNCQSSRDFTQNHNVVANWYSETRKQSTNQSGSQS